MFQKGNAGRPKGSKNKITNDVRQIFHEIYESMGDGMEVEDKITKKKRQMTGREAMLVWAQGNPTEFFRLYGKMIPTTAEITVDTHEDFLDELILEADGEEIPVVEAKDVTKLQAPANKELTSHDVTPSTPEIDANLV